MSLFSFLFPNIIVKVILQENSNHNTERGGSVVTHETRIREVEVFSGFLNLKIAKELVIFKDKCRVGPHIPLHESSFSNLSVTSPTSQHSLQPFRRFTYVTAHSPTLLSLLVRHKLFT